MCIVLEPIQAHLGSQPHIFSSRRLGFCLFLVFHRETDIFHCTCDTESFCCELLLRIGALSCFTPRWVAISPFMSEIEPHIHLYFIRICNFRLRVYLFLLVFFDSLAGKNLLSEVNRVVLS
jgi:hypothetical protein